MHLSLEHHDRSRRFSKIFVQKYRLTGSKRDNTRSLMQAVDFFHLPQKDLLMKQLVFSTTFYYINLDFDFSC